ncbi:2-oxoacid:acceptor oxidoreductase subunit alpha [Halococcoides cellulosivorans]|uniref:2-oxoglutarate synthase subunit KorA n=1 Tax=Halococcoides cellulosivorans TaxID=1679096 RepID=A0A2R4X1B5_9EURY|nr:2-oxoacid:acceptor oxidoreductase subunit alpha [Halococcoides cellulosivorans]AWB27592.1 2-oxoacid:acceptor oxidoreductase subunit alpha [Halococcoides cellulosivorans]
MTQDDLVWRIAGGSGDGIDSTSRNFAKALMRAGLHVFTHRHYPSRIRGGHTYVEVRASDEPVRSRGDGYNVLLALGDSFARSTEDEAYYGNEKLKPLAENLDELREGGIVIYDEGMLDEDDVADLDLETRAEENDWHLYPTDLRGIAREHGRDVMRNTAGVGVTAALLGIDPSYFETLMGESMDGDILDANLDVLSDAYEQTQEWEFTHDLEVPDGETEGEQALLNGSQGIAYGAIDEGCRFIAGYPMTPWTEVFSIMSKHLPKVGGIAEQVEDEIAAAALALGASHTGAKAMSGSSGGGFSLMSEPLGLAEMSETPVVLLEAQRAGPSTGMPTKPEQSDLEHVLYTSQGDSTRVVFAPANAEECYEQTRRAFEVAYEYQLPAIIMYDQKLEGELRNVPVEFFDRETHPDPGTILSEDEIAEAAHHASGTFARFKRDAEKGISPRSVPGQKGGRHLTSGNETNEWGHICEDPENRKDQVDRRFSKFEHIAEDLAGDESLVTRHGPADADYGVITWGSQQGTVFEAVDRLNADGQSVAALGVSQIKPFPAPEIEAFIEGVDEVVVVEMNASGQFKGLVQKELGAYGEKLSSLLKYNGNPFEPREIVEAVENTAAGDRDAPDDATTFVPATGD